MVSRSEDSINFDKLEREVLSAVSADAKYQRENDAKLRAVNQRVASYDEFRDIVLASHLKPLEKDERIEKVTDNFVNKWNVCADSASTETQQQPSQPLTKCEKLPKNGLEFARDWRRACKTDNDKYSFLLDIGGEKLRDIFKAEISQGLLGDILCALCSGYQAKDCEDIMNILTLLQHVKRFSLSVQFLSLKEKDACKALLKKMSETVDTCKHLYDVYEIKQDT